MDHVRHEMAVSECNRGGMADQPAENETKHFIVVHSRRARYATLAHKAHGYELTTGDLDGQVDDLNAPKRAYDQIKSLDPYHPVSLCLNCENYYYQEYSAGADIILSDVYPIGTNTSWSTQYKLSLIHPLLTCYPKNGC